ncbi:MAG: hypothetical protein NTU90_04975, partial [Proteobacteria bacterium]|nr:hypothetical protein [Pseudomonadota bacterium]
GSAIRGMQKPMAISIIPIFLSWSIGSKYTTIYSEKIIFSLHAAILGDDISLCFAHCFVTSTRMFFVTSMRDEIMD